MADLFDFNHGGVTHPGAQAIVHPAADCDRHTVRYRVVEETEEHITLDDGYTYDKRTGAVRGPDGRLSMQNRRAATEGSAMFASWAQTAQAPGRQHLQSGPAHSRAQVLKGTTTALRRLLRRG